MYKVLIVEDEHLIRKWLVYGIDYEALNCIVIAEADDGEEGIRKIKELKPNIVITDINMPIKNAFEMFDETKDFLYAKIIISGYGDFINAKQAISHNVTEFVVKPIDEKQLCEGIKKAIADYKVQKNYVEHRQDLDMIISFLETDNQNIEIHDIVVRQMIAYAKEHYNEKFTFNDVAEYLNYSSTLLYKKFKDETGQTFNDFLNHYRIRCAITKIKEGNYHLYEISEMVGFSEYKYFNKVFKKYVGYSAKDFIKMITL